MNTKEIIKIIMNRDGVTEDEARNLVKEARGYMYEAICDGDYNEAEDIMMDFLGLETDYIFDII